SLGLKQCLENPWEGFLEKYPQKTELEGEIKNITEFGLFVGLPGDIDGMVHLSDLDWSRPGEEAIKDYKKGDRVKVKVLDVDVEKERISLGIKQLTDDPFERAATAIKKGDVVTCTVTKVLDSGIEVGVADGATGFIRKAELSRDRVDQRPDRFAVAEKVDAKVISIDRAARRQGEGQGRGQGRDGGRDGGRGRSRRGGRKREIARALCKRSGAPPGTGGAPFLFAALCRETRRKRRPRPPPPPHSTNPAPLPASSRPKK